MASEIGSKQDKVALAGKIIDKFGTPMIVLGFVAFVIYANLPRYVDAQINVMNSQAETLADMQDTLRNSNIALDQISQTSSEQKAFMRQVLDDHVRQCESLQDIQSKVSRRTIIE